MGRKIQHIWWRLRGKKPEGISDAAMSLYLGAIILFFLGLFLLAWFGYQYATKGTLPVDFSAIQENIVEQFEDCKHARVLDGTCVRSASKVHGELYAVMIENHTAARPQSGLVDAAIVYEAPVEANFSRFMALYPIGSHVEKIGPVRSARSYYVDWLMEHGSPMYMHVGGSPESLELIEKRDVFDLNEFARGWYYWRGVDRSAPHNVYTSSKLAKKAWKDYGESVEVVTSTSWSYEDREQCTDECVDEIQIVFSRPNYVIDWKYNTSTERYERYQGGTPHTDADGRIIAADTVVVQRVSSKTIDDIGRKRIDTIGNGVVEVFRDGYQHSGTWSKERMHAKTAWLAADKSSLPLKAGKIWIEVLGQDGSMTLK